MEHTQGQSFFTIVKPVHLPDFADLVWESKMDRPVKVKGRITIFVAPKFV